jgi:hypothetical protein
MEMHARPLPLAQRCTERDVFDRRFEVAVWMNYFGFPGGGDIAITQQPTLLGVCEPRVTGAR